MWWLLLLACSSEMSVGDYAQARSEVFCTRQAECYGLSPDDTCEDESFEVWMQQLNWALDEGCTFESETAQECIDTLWDSTCSVMASEPEPCPQVMTCE